MEQDQTLNKPSGAGGNGDLIGLAVGPGCLGLSTQGHQRYDGGDQRWPTKKRHLFGRQPGGVASPTRPELPPTRPELPATRPLAPSGRASLPSTSCPAAALSICCTAAPMASGQNLGP